MISVTLQQEVCLAVAGTIPFYVVRYYPPEKQGDQLPPHEHVEQSSVSVSSQPAIFAFAGNGATRTVLPVVQWPVKY